MSESLATAGKGKTSIVQKLHEDTAYQNFCRNGLGIAKYDEAVAQLVKQISFRHPTVSIIEIGKTSDFDTVFA